IAAWCALKAVLVDLSSTLHIEDSAVLGMQEALRRQATFFTKFCFYLHLY
uniref:Uncharacterized protein n=1 Tax=Strix occidentalis caurina TaxID=311401 RepID=A0A8D0KSW5_STROC